tara:strand:+ start:503 stop:1072 length:570 start_codon:yes stop_codon:yes gene_type:complete
MSNFDKLTLITGPSGVGKGSLVQKLLERHRDLWLSVSATTRQPREGESEGEHYFFLQRKEFEELILKKGFLEWAEFAGNLYGTPSNRIQEQLDKGIRALMEIELQGARQVRKSCPEAFQIFIAPPTFVELEKRIRGRGTESEEDIQKRLIRASEEMNAINEFDAVVINDSLNKALSELEGLIRKRKITN